MFNVFIYIYIPRALTNVAAAAAAAAREIRLVEKPNCLSSSQDCDLLHCWKILIHRNKKCLFRLLQEIIARHFKCNFSIGHT